MIYHLIKSSYCNEYILWVTNYSCSEGLLLSRWSDSIKEAVDPRELTPDGQPYNTDWISNNNVILKTATPISWPMLVTDYPELLV